MIEHLIISAMALLCMTTLGILIVITGYREYRLRKKVELLNHMIDSDYETMKVDINNL